jgi:hypothetical protein
LRKTYFLIVRLGLIDLNLQLQQRMRMRKEEQVDKEKIKRDREEKRWESKGICRIFLFVHMKRKQ